MQERRRITIHVNGEAVEAEEGATLAAVLLSLRLHHFRSSALGEPRAPLCGMGTCFECRVMVDGRPHVRACMELCRPGMEVRTGA